MTTAGASNGKTHYIVWILRFKSAKVDDEVAALNFAGQIANLVPTAIVFNKTAENLLGLSYII